MRNIQREEIENNEEKMIIEYFNESDWFDKIKKKNLLKKKKINLKIEKIILMQNTFLITKKYYLI